MEVPVNSLRDLHLLHRRIRTLREQIQRGPRQVQARERHVAQESESLQKAQQELKDLKVSARQKESRRLGMDNRIRELQTKINTARSNREYATLVAERESDIAARGALEDEILDLMLREDEQVKRIQSEEAELKRFQAELQQLARSVEEQSGQLAEELALAQEKLKQHEPTLPGQVQDVYRRLVTLRGEEALANVENHTCTGCNTEITPQMVNELLMSLVILCKSCGRILYLEQNSVESTR